ncbi:thiosulfate sulfurtransferase [Thiogranum longum]|uniref:Thiosulfate sulfurtransferase n=1 Tax=Thiogranum longum TaxID=1537524 RepID=A0A4R1H7U9_9GAMM|nr:rhodanese-like domain-containing protein [Thiogranum longum]TCK17907.1 thiosulfate sulfurtransferase [Thiogranum longum]
MTEPLLPLITEPEQLEAALGGDKLVVVHISKPVRYAEFHVPGAIYMQGSQFVRVEKPVMGLLPHLNDLQQLLEASGVSPDTHVVAYDDEGGGWASRLLWTLDCIGHKHFSLLNGGLVSWISEGFPASRDNVQPGTGHYPVFYQDGPVADAEYILGRLGDADFVPLDSRTPQEFNGEKKLAARGGHIPGAQLLNWVDTMDQSRNLRFKPEAELRTMLETRGITPDKEVLCYCQSHHRSSHACIMLKSLGYPHVKGYPGAWSDWGNRPDTPVD